MVFSIENEFQFSKKSYVSAILFSNARNVTQGKKWYWKQLRQKATAVKNSKEEIHLVGLKKKNERLCIFPRSPIKFPEQRSIFKEQNFDQVSQVKFSVEKK